jgi:HlyD family secretion protein
MSKFVKLFLFLIPLSAAGAWGWWHFYGHNGQKSEFITVPVDKGEISSTISATGTIEPEEVIDIGAQVAGMIKEFGRDLHSTNSPIDYGSQVEEGTVLARIDESLYERPLIRLLLTCTWPRRMSTRLRPTSSP